MIILSKEQVLQLHTNLIKATGGSDGIRDEGMLDSALNSPFQSFGEKEPYFRQKAVRSVVSAYGHFGKDDLPWEK